MINIRYPNPLNDRHQLIYNGPADGSDIATAIGLDKNGNVYVTGTFSTVKYNTLIKH